MIARDRVAGAARAALTVHATGFAPRVVERILKIQIGFLALLALLAPLGGFRLEAWLAPLLAVQAGLTYWVLLDARRTGAAWGRWLYCGIAAVTYVEAKRYTGLVGAAFALEAVLALIALWYLFALRRGGTAETEKGTPDGSV